MTGGDDQLRLGFRPFHNRELFADGFLSDRLTSRPDFESLDASELFGELRGLWERERAGLLSANEAQTEERFVQPVLRALGFAYTVQVGMRVGTGRRQPDYALFLDEDRRRDADGLTGRARFRAAVAIADAKRFDWPLERPGRRAAGDDPVAQIVNYVLITGCPWGVLTNGRLWRLYAAAGDLVEGACYEIDLVALLESGTEREFRYFAAFFSAQAFALDAQGRSFLERALEESTANAVAVGRALEAQVFAAVPLIAQGLLGEGERSRPALSDAFDHALVLLYRLLFCLHAEARALLPIDNPHYARYSLRSHKAQLARDRDGGRVLSGRSDDLYNDLRALFRIVDQGDERLGVAEYNGGLFSAARHSYFEGRSVPDDLLAPALDGLYRVAGEFVDYRELSIRHLGTIYERLLQFRLIPDDRGTFALEPAPGRHETGSYFTPEQVVDRIVERTLEPALEARSRTAAQAELSGEQALEVFLSLRVLDPAMGSAHFLVGACAYIAQYIVTDPAYGGELSLLEVQRLVAERCLYGVDVNPLAVELAQLSLWLTTVREGEPLTFLHNLREGNSLVGADLAALLQGGESIFAQHLAREAEALLDREAEIARLDSHTGEDLHEKERLARAAEALRVPLEAFAEESVAPSFTEPVGRAFHWELEFPEVFLAADGRPRADGGFDAVIGNPPWVRIQELGRELAAYCRGRYQTARGAFDAYVVFLERGISVLHPDGRLGFIVPNKLLKLDYGKRLRERLASDRLVEEIVDFGDAQLFEGATNYSCILILDRQGTPDLVYRRVRGDYAAVRRALTNLDATPAERFSIGGLGGDPWVLAAGEEAKLLRAAQAGSERLDHVTGGIFTGLQTSADQIYIVEDRGRRGSNQLVYSRASGRELELEPDMLHPLASGGDVRPYAFGPLRNLLIFPYRRRDDKTMHLLTTGEFGRLTLTDAYLREHEQTLRGREGGKMDHDGWYGYVYPKSLGAHDLPKLGVPRLCEHLRASADPQGGIYLDNVDVNGVLVREGAPSAWTLSVLLNSRLLDFVFQLGSVPFRGQYLSANKQFIAPLPIRLPNAGQTQTFDAFGQRLHATATSVSRERQGFLDWLGGALGVRASQLPGPKTLLRFDEHTPDELATVLRRGRSKLVHDPTSRAFREQLDREHAASLDRLAPLVEAWATDRAAANQAVYDLYELTTKQRELVETE